MQRGKGGVEHLAEVDRNARIAPVLAVDLPEILALQKKAFASEAQALNNWNIPPLTQTLQSLTEDWQNGVLLKALDENGVLAGSVRATIREGTAHVSKLMVLPEMRGRGYGAALLRAIERICGTDRYELFTGAASKSNLRLYARAGYHPFKQEELMPGVPLVWLEKFVCKQI